MKVSDLLEEKFIINEFEGNSKEEVITELINLFKDDPRVISIDDVKMCVLDREKIMSTGVGKGFAIPHGKTNSIKDILAAFGKSRRPVDYDALDGEPVNLVFLLVGKDAFVGKHIKLLSRISRLMNSDEFRSNLMNAESKQEILNIFKEEEENYPDV